MNAITQPLPDHRTSTRNALSLAWLTLWPRLAFVAVTMLFLSFPWERWVAMRDGARYIDYAFHLGAGNLETVRQVGLTLPGYPIAVLLPGHLLGNGLAGVAINIAGAVLTVLLFRQVVGITRLARLLAVFPPAWILYSSIVMTEGLFLALVMLAVLCFVRRRESLAFIVFSVTMLVKLQAVFPAGACLLLILVRRRYLQVVTMVLVTASLPFLWAIWCRHAWGDALIILHRYPDMWDGNIFAWPFESLVRCSVDPAIPLWKKLYVWLHVAAAIAGCVLMVRRWRRDPRDEMNLLWTAWLVTNTACLLCLGYIWGFHEFHRYMLAALPPLIVAGGDLAPRRAWVHQLLGLAAVCASVFAVAY